MSDALISVNQLCCKSGRHYLLNHIDWMVHRGENWVVFGLNGCGKTTLLSVVAGFRKYTSGNIELFGEPITAGNVVAQRKKIGWVSSSFFDNYYRNESILNIILAGKTGMLGIDDTICTNDVRKAKMMLEQIGLEDKGNMPFCTLSKGERQNVLLIRAMFSQPEILILDEPCSGLDIIARERVLQSVKKIIGQKRTTVIYVTHYAEEILDDFSHVLLMKNGKVFLQGEVDECLNDKKLGDFLGVPVTVGKDEEQRLKIRFLPEGEGGE